MSHLIAIAFSDLHLFKFKLFNKGNSRLEWSLKALKEIGNAAIKLDVPILFAGDLFHTPAHLENETLNLAIDYYQRYIDQRHIDFFAISGNHDMSEKNGLKHISPSYLKVFYNVFRNFHLCDGMELPWTTRSGLKIQGIPYYNNEHELRKQIKNYGKVMDTHKGYKILLLHGDCPGTMDNGHEVPENGLGTKSNLKKLFASWDQVIFGHIHQPQKITKKILMCGSPIAQISSDKAQMGYWKIFTDQPPEFVGLVNFPKFVKLGKDEIIMNPESAIDYYIPYEDAGKIEEVEAGEFDLGNSRKTLAKRYMKAKGIKDKAKKSALIKVLNSVE